MAVLQQVARIQDDKSLGSWFVAALFTAHFWTGFFKVQELVLQRPSGSSRCLLTMAEVNGLCSYFKNHKTAQIAIWVWVKIGYPNNWMVNTKLD
jgi:hypothetical protein